MDAKRVFLVADDSEMDVQLLQLAIKKAQIPNQVRVVKDGQEAIDYLSGNGRFADRKEFPFPGGLFLDLNMPRISGFEVLEWMKDHEDCKLIPVMVLSNSGLEEDVKRAYQLGANAYMVKPGKFDGLVAILRTSFEFWCLCRVPFLMVEC